MDIHCADKSDNSERHHNNAPKRNMPEPQDPSKRPAEIGGQSGPEPTRYGDWEKNGRCTDF